MGLGYSFGSEDWRTEQKALKIEPDNHVVCITSSGDRPLNLLSTNCLQITSVDVNPIQNHLLDLKRAAMLHLDYPSYLEFLGITNHQKGRSLPRKVFEELRDESKMFWIHNSRLIEKGVIYQGQLERSCSYFAQIMRLFRGLRPSKLTSFDDITQQREYLSKSWNKRYRSHFLKLALQSIDREVRAHVAPEVSSGQYIYSRIQQTLHRHLAKENPLFSLIVNGFVEKEAFSPHMLEEHIPEIQSRLNRLTIKTQNMIEFLEAQEAESIDRFSFSDIASYMDGASFNRMIRAAIRTARPGARFCIRQFMSDHQLDSDLTAYLAREPQLERELEEEDRSFVYRFMAGQIIKSREKPLVA